MLLRKGQTSCGTGTTGHTGLGTRAARNTTTAGTRNSERLPSHGFPLQHLLALALNLVKAALGDPSAAEKAAKLARRDVKLPVTQHLIYPVHAMLLREKLINQGCISNAAP